MTEQAGNASFQVIGMRKILMLQIYNERLSALRRRMAHGALLFGDLLFMAFLTIFHFRVVCHAFAGISRRIGMTIHTLYALILNVSFVGKFKRICAALRIQHARMNEHR
jgi:hypothetical protein